MHGLHLTADLHDCQCDPRWMTDAPLLLAAVTRAVAAAGLTPVGQLAHPFAATPAGPGGVTCAVLLAESHLCLHTWPEQGSVALDVYVCNFSADHSAAARALHAALVTLFVPGRVTPHTLQRGSIAAPPA
ncbi:adenosylmethionine decarboxylase [Pseudacidovorax intermedius]|uniref:S-adenosylmethionine decarboxylase n=1 Tax=Pseudacidovorax intermedius TaxID=433924 RepID=A0A147GLZ5_9BURK|nr:adenosylmethionine decarboxylase [Pseudacidovorax intermedius]KTT14554.1 S-adenosylmethionine decarboxylase [Pseudacidovorax intermedius]